MLTENYKRFTAENKIAEADAMSACDQSKYVPRFIESFQLGDETFLVTKFMEGGDLMNYLEKQGVNRLPEERAKNIFVQVAKGVRDIHEQNIVHRDLKHLNLFLNDTKTAFPKVSIGDFGLACKLKKGETMTRRTGTCAFMAPELVKEEENSFPVDIWAMGVILYALISSEVPFNGADKQSTFAKILDSEVSFSQSAWENVSPECIDLIKQMLCKDASKRLNVRGVLSHPWLANFVPSKEAN